MTSRLDGIRPRRAALMPLNKWTVNGISESMSLEDSPIAQDIDALLAVVDAAREYMAADKAWKDAENDDCMDEADVTVVWATETDAYLALQGTLAALEGEE